MGSIIVVLIATCKLLFEVLFDLFQLFEIELHLKIPFSTRWLPNLISGLEGYVMRTYPDQICLLEELFQTYGVREWKLEIEDITHILKGETLFHEGLAYIVFWVKLVSSLPNLLEINFEGITVNAYTATQGQTPFESFNIKFLISPYKFLEKSLIQILHILQHLNELLLKILNIVHKIVFL